MTTTHYSEYLSTTFGLLLLQASEHGLTSITFAKDESKPSLSNLHTKNTAKQLIEYFAGNRAEFDISLDVQGTHFQQQVWQQLRQIPIGETRSYAHIAQQINNPKAVRAVGAANGRNPIAIVVPCHRVIGSNGSLTGYAWGTTIKADLLALEQSIRQRNNAN
ncbi:methylated-DNA--[protein]-cysteine S-methyltransferase [Paraglaciecola aquimarina]|uniref:Methylated-DNA--protein-cysteine methyltransferase n=1 Tax=Paraglaciecola aquimarina TaxID=1235557 RepID=A0ABU3SV00_9ALTE|nr:methylated-DNA--[protein]-cysteine S-methyltransferase [Paraglaciecola aquimarina]MDU0353787.1 methylated-DNA--[protein]-cysteine S-methyltransferase [Paraglaciecola aquimarina]